MVIVIRQWLAGAARWEDLPRVATQVFESLGMLTIRDRDNNERTKKTLIIKVLGIEASVV